MQNQSVVMKDLWSAINSFEDSISTHEGLLTSNEAKAMWSNQIYKKQNEMMIKALTKEGPYETPYSFPIYTEKKFEIGTISKKKVCKEPPVKPGDDWWIML